MRDAEGWYNASKESQSARDCDTIQNKSIVFLRYVKEWEQYMSFHYYLTTGPNLNCQVAALRHIHNHNNIKPGYLEIQVQLIAHGRGHYGCVACNMKATPAVNLKKKH